MQWGNRRRFAIIGSWYLIIRSLILGMGTHIASFTHSSYFMLAFIMMAISMVLLSMGVMVLVVGSLRAS